MQEIIAKIRDILSTFQQQYKSAAATTNATTTTTNTGDDDDVDNGDGGFDSSDLVGGVLPAIDDPNFEFFFEQLSESYA